MNQETRNQIASVMLQSGTPEQQEEALAYCGFSKGKPMNQDDANAEQTSKKIRELKQKVTELEAWNDKIGCTNYGLRQQVAEQAALIEKLQGVIKAVELDSDECMDFDECTAMLIPLDTYHQLIEAIPTDSKQVLNDWMRERLGEPVAYQELFEAIAAATKPYGGGTGVSISVKAFNEQVGPLHKLPEFPERATYCANAID